ncbi:MAG: elongation factor G [Deltaproteobacteria bacterium]|nr:elongation factor G [Deltaproteobacteria bacterium]
MGSVETLRNIAFVAHGGAGKTSLAEVMLFNTGVTNRQGNVVDGNTVMDFEPEEVKRGSSISTGLHQIDWKKNTINILDTPGDQNFFSDTRSCLQAADAAVLLIDGVDGVKVQTEAAWEYAAEFNMPLAIFINKLDRERSGFSRTFEDAANLFTPKPILVQLPIGKEMDFNGVVDLITMKAFSYDEKGKSTPIDIPADMQDQVESEHEALVENLAEADDDLLERYLEGVSLSEDDMYAALKKGTQDRSFVQVLCGSATKNIGIDKLCDLIVGSLPNPAERSDFVGTDTSGDEELSRPADPQAPFSAFVFKTVTDPYAGQLSVFRVVSGNLGSDGGLYNATQNAKERFSQLLRMAGKEQKPANGAGPGAIVAVAKLKNTRTGDTLCDDSSIIKFNTVAPLPSLISFAVEAKNQGDEDKIFSSLSKLLQEDTALKLDRNSETKEILLSGRGEIHIEIAVEKLKRKFNVEVLLNPPKVPYRETFKKKVRVQGRHKKQTGGHGQFGDCWIQLEPKKSGEGFEFVNAIVGGAIPRTYIPAVEKGVIEAAQRGVLAGFPVVDFRVTLDDGSYHAVDSSEMAFKIAGSLAFRKAAVEASPVLLEPIMDVAITTPDEYMGDIMGDLNSRRGRVLGMDSKGKNQIIKAQVPMSEFLSYAKDLRSITGGRGTFSMNFARYEEIPAQLSQKIVEEINARKD